MKIVRMHVWVAVAGTLFLAVTSMTIPSRAVGEMHSSKARPIHRRTVGAIPKISPLEADRSDLPIALPPAIRPLDSEMIAKMERVLSLSGDIASEMAQLLAERDQEAAWTRSAAIQESPEAAQEWLRTVEEETERSIQALLEPEQLELYRRIRNS